MSAIDWILSSKMFNNHRPLKNQAIERQFIDFNSPFFIHWFLYFNPSKNKNVDHPKVNLLTQLFNVSFNLSSSPSNPSNNLIQVEEKKRS